MEEQKIRLSAMNMLARREHSRSELVSKLTVKYNEESVHTVLERLQEEGLQSDQRFLESFVSSRVRRGYGPVKIIYELGQRGIDSESVSEELEKYRSKWLELAREQLEKKYGDLPPVDFKEKQKRQRFIASRGFSHEICYKLF